MSKGLPLDPEILCQIPELRKQGLSFYKIAERLGIGESTARKHQSYTPSTQFTKRQLEIAIAAAEKNARK